MTVRYFITNGTTSLLLLALLIVANAIGASAMNRKISNDEIQRRLNQLNKPPVKSIQSPDGDIIDCVVITEQPAFDHPLLKNHTIQMMPDSYPEEIIIKEGKASLNDDKERDVVSQLWHMNGECPDNTVPIKRTTKEDLLRANKIDHYMNKSSSYVLEPSYGHEYATVYAKGSFHGAKARINVWKPRVQESGEFSLSQIWLLNGYTNSDISTVEAGWQVDPLRGDNNPKFFIFWTGDTYTNTGCYNILCPGFVQINKKIALGASIGPVSTYGGSQFEITLHIWKGLKLGHWWLQYGEHVVGYWPRSIVPTLADDARQVSWGGEVVNHMSNGQHTSTEMGNGHFAGEKYKKASYFANLQVVDKSDNLVNIEPKRLGRIVTNPNCYDLFLGSSRISGTTFFFGGPGRNPRCP